MTAAGDPCRRSAQQDSKFCASHRPVGKRTASVRARTAPKPAAGAGRGRATTSTRRSGSRVHVAHDGYRLYRKGNRYYFSKRSRSELVREGAEPVYEMPPDREIKVTQNGLPVLKGK